MIDNYYGRWCEIQFYYICKSTFKKNNDYTIFFHLAKALQPYGEFDLATIREAFVYVLSNHTVVPTKDETVILAYENKYPIARTKKLLKTSNKYYYARIDKHKIDPMGIYPKVKHEHLLEEIVKFVEAYHNMKGEFI